MSIAGKTDTLKPKGPITHFTDGGIRVILGSEILAKRDYLSRHKNIGTFRGLCFSSTQINNNIAQFIAGVGILWVS